MLDLTKIFKKAAGVGEDRKGKIEAAVHTLKTELSCDMMISQEAADALDVMYEMAADHVSHKDLEMALREISEKRDAFGGTGYGVEADIYNHCIGIIEKHVYKEV